jgi:3-oxoacyl-(acyl-carrier-protein) synthase
LSLAATTLACTDAGFTEQLPIPSDCSVLLGSTHGSSSYCVDYYRQIVEGGFIAANPMLFAEGVPNAAAAHLSLMLGIRGACQTVIGSRTAGLDALRLASLRIASGQWDRAIVGAAEEYLPLINDGYRQCGLYSGGGENGFVTGSGAVTFVLESRDAMEKRGGRCRGVLGSSASLQIHQDGAIDVISSLVQRLGDARQI